MRKVLVSLAIALALATLGFVVVLHLFAPSLREMVRHRVESHLQHRFKSSVQIGDFDISLLPGIRGRITGLGLRYEDRTDTPPLIEVAEIRFETNFLQLLLPNPTVNLVVLKGLQIHIPPREPGDRALLGATDRDLAKKYPILILKLVADDALLVILPKQADKPVQEYPVHHLELHDFGLDRPADFIALLSIPLPQGDVHATGEFGPWEADEPSVTPVKGKYVLANANMGTLKGLNGIMGSAGTFEGPLDYLAVNGETEIPNFSLRISNNPVDLHTKFSAIVDGTNGDTILKAVTAHFARTTLDVTGMIVDRTKMNGKTIDLDAVSREARIEDLLRLAVKSDPPVMTGPARVKTKIHIAEGNDDILQRIKLDGAFGVGQMEFTNPAVQQKVDGLSHRAQGRPNEQPGENELSQLSGSFRDDKGVMTFSNLSFSVSGAALTLAGTYNMDSGEMDFHGKLQMKAKLSQTTTGAKSFFLKAVDPFFTGKNGGTLIPIKITGTKDHPSFGLDQGHKDAK
jgi:hypothetical protein